jgi:acetolactate synthase small subunit
LQGTTNAIKRRIKNLNQALADRNPDAIAIEITAAQAELNAALSAIEQLDQAILKVL